MSEDTPEVNQEELDKANELTKLTDAQALEQLKRKADTLGVKYSNNIGVDALRAKINDKMNPKEEVKPEAKQSEKKKYDDGTPLNEIDDPAEIRKRIRERALKLVRVRISNNNPEKNDYPGETITVQNRYVGTVRKVIPYGEGTDEGYHVPQIILDAIKNRKYTQLRTRKNSRGVNGIPERRLVKEFSIEVLPPLTEEELKELARKQAAARGQG